MIVGTADRWTIATVSLRCRHCAAVIGAGELVRLVTKNDLPYCEASARAVLEETPPRNVRRQRIRDRLKPPARTIVEAHAQSSRAVVDTLERSQPTVTRAELQGRALAHLDMRMRQAGRDD